MTKRLLFALVSLFLATLPITAQSVLAQWNFNGLTDTNNPPPSTGAGVITLLGGVTGSYASGTGSTDTASPNSAINITKFPAQGTGAKTAGIQFGASTVGYESITLNFDFRASNTGANNLAVLYTTDGSTFILATNLIITVPAAFTNHLTADLSSVPGVNNNASFAVRVVADFAPNATAYTAVNSSSSYGTAGTWRFDIATITGNPAGGGGNTAPVITSQPVNQTNVVGTTAVFNLGATGALPLFYQWFFGANPISGANSSTLSLPNIDTTNAGIYLAIITNSLGKATSAPVTLTVISAPPSSAIITNIAYLHTLQDNVNFKPTDTTNLFQVEGIVTTFTNLTSGTANALFYFQDDTAGIAVFWAGGFANLPAAGAKVRVVAPLTSFNGLLELAPSSTKPTTSVTVLTTGNPQPTPVPLDFGWLNDPLAIEPHEGQLVIVENGTLDPIATAGIFASGKTITMTAADGISTIALFVNAGTDLVGQGIPAGPVTVIGVLGQFDSSDPRTSSYQLIPSRYADVQSNLKPPRISFTNYLADLVRPGDAPTNSFTDFGLRPGEKLTVAVAITDPSGKPFTITVPTDSLPTGGAWSLSSTSAGAGETITGTFTCAARAADAGKNFAVILVAENDSAPSQLVINVYVPTKAEQRVLISEFYANPTATATAPNYNPLNRVELLPGTTGLSPSNRDEYVEVVNLSDETVDLTGWVVTDALLRRAYIYPGTAGAALTSSNSVVIYGGPSTGYTPQLTVAAIPSEVGPTDPPSTAGLALNDTGDTIVLRNTSSNVIARVVYSAAMVSTDSSTTRFPTSESDFVAHRTAGALYTSPGLQSNGQPWSVPQVAPVTSITVSATLTAGGLKLTWNTVAGATYKISRSTTATGTYQTLQSGLTVGTYTDSVSGNSAFYRISSP